MAENAIDLTGDTPAPAAAVASAGQSKRCGMEALAGRVVMKLPEKRQILLDVASMNPNHLFEPEELAQGESLFTMLTGTRKAIQSRWQAGPVAEHLFTIYDLLEQLKHSRAQRSMAAKTHRNGPVQKLYDLIHQCITKDKADAVIGGAAKKQKGPGLKMLKGTDVVAGKKAPQFDPAFVSAVQQGRLVSFSFACVSCGHKSCYPVQPKDEVDKQNKQIAATNEKKKEEAKAAGKTYRTMKSVSQEVVCMCTAVHCNLQVAPSTCKDCDANGSKPVSDPHDPKMQICQCEKCMCRCTAGFKLADREQILLDQYQQSHPNSAAVQALSGGHQKQMMATEMQHHRRSFALSMLQGTGQTLEGGEHDLDPVALRALGVNQQERALGAAARSTFCNPSFTENNALRVSLRHDMQAPPSSYAHSNGKSIQELRRAKQQGGLDTINEQTFGVARNDGYAQDNQRRSRNGLINADAAATATARSGDMPPRPVPSPPQPNVSGTTGDDPLVIDADTPVACVSGAPPMPPALSNNSDRVSVEARSAKRMKKMLNEVKERRAGAPKKHKVQWKSVGRKLAENSTPHWNIANAALPGVTSPALSTESNYKCAVDNLAETYIDSDSDSDAD